MNDPKEMLLELAIAAQKHEDHARKTRDHGDELFRQAQAMKRAIEKLRQQPQNPPHGGHGTADAD